MADTIDQQFIEYIVKGLVGNPDAVKVTRTIDEKGVLLEMYVDPTDLGRVIGRNGATAKSIRILLRALGVKNDARYNLKIVDTNPEGRPPRRDDRPREADSDHAQSGADAPRDDAVVTDEQPASDATEAEQTPEPEVAQPEAEQPEDDIVRRSREELKDLDLDL